MEKKQNAPPVWAGPGWEREGAELEAVLSAGFFSRAPSLAQFLTYICRKQFAGEGDQIKEYNIAVDGLGRPASFDPKTDSVIRVEANRLRKRLQQYYEAEGASHEVRITIPPGQYAPVFVYRGQHANGASAEGGGEAAETVVARPGPWRRRGAVLALGAGTVVLFAIALAVGVRQRGSQSGPVVREQAPVAGGALKETRILAGSRNRYIDKDGNLWVPDTYFTGGAAAASPAAHVSGTPDPEIFRSRREGQSFRYDIPLPPARYELRLWFAETIFGPGNMAGGGETSRLFDVKMNGKPVLNQYDVLANAGAANAAHGRVFKDVSPAADGYLHLAFDKFKESPILSGIEITPGRPGRLNPVRILVRDSPYTDSAGRQWGVDRYFSGGVTVARPGAVAGTGEPELYRGERYGHFTYTIPVAEGRYTLRLLFAESWFGPDRPGGGGGGSRVFDVYLNGAAVLRGFDIFKEAGGSARAVEKVFRGLVPNPQGNFRISFVPAVNYACVNGIELVDEGQ